MKLAPRNTPHSTIEPLTGSASLNSSYSAAKRVTCARRAYRARLARRVGRSSALREKTSAMAPGTRRSASVCRPPGALVSVVVNAAPSPAMGTNFPKERNLDIRCMSVKE